MRLHAVALGQALSVLIALTGIFSSVLVQKVHSGLNRRSNLYVHTTLTDVSTPGDINNTGGVKHFSALTLYLHMRDVIVLREL